MRGFAFGAALTVFAQTRRRRRPQPRRRRPAAPQTQKPAPAPAPPQPAPRAGRQPRRPPPKPFPGRRQDRLRRAAAHRQRVSRRQGRDGQDSGAAAEEGGRAERQEQAAAEASAEARKRRLGHERDRAGRCAEAGRAAADRHPALHAGRAGRRSRICRTSCSSSSSSASSRSSPQVGQEKGLHFIFNGPDSGMVWADPGLDISADVIKKLDATPAAKPPVK